MDIEVVKGTKWIGDDLIDENRTIYKVRKDRNHMMLGEITSSKLEDGSTKCKL